MARLTPLSPRQVRKRFRKLGFKIEQGGDRFFAVRGTKKVKLPNPHRGDVSVELIVAMLNQADISREEWLAQ